MTHPVLVELGKDHRDLPLAEGIVKGVIDRLDRNVQTRGLRAINLHMELKAALC